jgi:lipopolysaccharide biosynthesis regulator YciM
LSDERSQAREELRDWARAREHWDRAIEYLKLARDASNPDVQNRYVTIAQHYRELAQAEERCTDQKGAERRSRKEPRREGGAG